MANELQAAKRTLRVSVALDLEPGPPIRITPFASWHVHYAFDWVRDPLEEAALRWS